MERTLGDIENDWSFGNLSALREALQEAYEMGVRSGGRIVNAANASNIPEGLNGRGPTWL